MIYEFPPADAPLRQGDVCVGLPRVEVPLLELEIVGDTGPLKTNWDTILRSGEQEVSAILPVRPVKAIVATQDCDASRNPDITLCEIRDFRVVEGKAKDAKSPKSWVPILTQHARLNLKWFYLPPDAQIGFGDKCAVDFAVTIRVPRVELEEMRHLRKGRLNPLAEEHFRERIGEFFRRYAYDEWYPLSPEELAQYRKNYPDAEPFPWQQPDAST